MGLEDYVPIEGIEPEGAGAIWEEGDPPNDPVVTKVVTESTSAVTIHWTHDDLGVDDFLLERSLDQESWSSVDTIQAGTSPYSYEDSGLDIGGRYYYRVSAHNSLSGYSNTSGGVGYVLPIRMNFGEGASGFPQDYLDSAQDYWWAHDHDRITKDGTEEVTVAFFPTPVSGTTDSSLYQAQCHPYPDDTIQIRFDVTPGTYNVKAKFEEGAHSESGLRVFDINDPNDTLTKVDDLDVYDEVGKYAAHDEAFSVIVEAGEQFALNIIASVDVPLISALSIETASVDIADLAISIGFTDPAITVSPGDMPVTISMSDPAITVSTGDMPITISMSGGHTPFQADDMPINIGFTDPLVDADFTNHPRLITVPSSSRAITVLSADRAISVPTNPRTITVV
jgi:hypothetical protein